MLDQKKKVLGSPAHPEVHLDQPLKVNLVIPRRRQFIFK